MNTVQRYFKKYLLKTLAAIGGFLLLNLILLALLPFLIRGVDFSPHESIPELSAKISAPDGAILSGEAAAEQLAAVDAWAMILDENGDVCWESRMPAGLSRHYSLTDVAKFSRWYIEDYPVFVWEHPRGLLVVGYAPGSIQRYSYAVEPGYYPRMVVLVLVAFAANLVLLLSLLLMNNRKVEKAIGPILSGIDTIAHGQPVHLAETGELSEIEAAINRTSEHLQRKDTARAEWINGVSHDIRTPLSVILGYAAEMEEDPALPRQVNERAGLIRQQGEKLRQRIIDLNLASRLEYAMQPMNVTTVDPVELARQAVSGFLNKGLDEKYRIDFSVGAGAERTQLEGDAALLSRMLDNAIGNSIVHNPDGCDIRVSVDRQAGFCVFTVQDSGVGAEPGILQILNGGAEESIGQNEHGNGGKLIRKIAAAHNGSAVFYPSEPHGLCVKIKIPYSP